METEQMNPSRKSVLVVCMLDSIHTARWLEGFRDEEIEFHLFPSTPNRKVHENIAKLIDSSSDARAKFKLIYKFRFFSIFFWMIDLVLCNRLRGYLISKYSKKYNIKLIHAIELNHAGYILTKAERFGLPSGRKLLLTSWGSDIFWFMRFPKHRKQLKKILEISDEFISECSRDHALASELGFQGKFWNPTPVSGGYSKEFLTKERILTSKRKLILVKGYESFVGRASIALEAVSNLKNDLEDFELHVYSANKKTQRIVRKLRKNSNLNITSYSKKSLTHMQMMELFSRARLYVGVSLSDGISVSLLESIASGAFPIQTNTSCGNEWITNGTTGMLIDPDVKSVMRAIKVAISDDRLVDYAMAENQRLAIEKLDQDVIHRALQNFYN